MKNPTTNAEAPKEASAAAEKKVLRKPRTTRTSTARKPRATKKKVEEKNTDNAAPVANAAEVTVIEPTEVNASETPVENAAETLEVNIAETQVENTEETPVENAADAKVINQPEVQAVEPIDNVAVVEEKVCETPEKEEAKPVVVEKPTYQEKPKFSPLPLPNITIRNIVDLVQAPQRAIILTDQQIQQLSMDEIEKRHLFLEETLARVLDYDIVLSDTNIWLELLIGHTSSHSDPRVNARLQFERQLEFISKLSLHRHGRFVMMGETYEEIDRFASLQDPANHKEADFTDNIVCLNTAARLAKRLILAEQRENRLRIEGIGAESHHAAFADPAIIRRVVELFAEGKKVLLLTNDASVAIRSMGLCDDLQRYNGISDDDWDEHYAPLRPMVMTFEDLRVLDYYTRQYHYLSMASHLPWMGTIDRFHRSSVEPLSLRLEAFKHGDKRKGDNLNPESITEKNTSSSQQQRLNQQKQKQQEAQQKQQKQGKKQNLNQQGQNQQGQNKQNQASTQNAMAQQNQQQAPVDNSVLQPANEQTEVVEVKEKPANAPVAEKSPIADTTLVEVEAKDGNNAVAVQSETSNEVVQQEQEAKPRPKSRRRPQSSRKVQKK